MKIDAATKRAGEATRAANYAYREQMVRREALRMAEGKSEICFDAGDGLTTEASRMVLAWARAGAALEVA